MQGGVDIAALGLPFLKFGKPTGKVAGKAVIKGAKKVAPKIVEKIAPEVEPLAETIISKFKGGLDYALKMQKETKQLYKTQRGIKAAKLTEVFAEPKGVETYFEALRGLKGKLGKAEFKMPAEFQFTSEEANQMINKIAKMPMGVFQKTNTSEAFLKLSGVLTDETGLPMQLQKNDIELLQAAFPELNPIINAYKSMGSKAWEIFIDAINIPRAVLSAGDFSITFRQLALAIARKPQLLPGTIKAQVRTIFSPKNWQILDDIARKDADVQLFIDAKMYLAPPPGKYIPKLWMREEQFQSNLAEKLPFIGRLVRASERAFTAGANYVRVAMAKDYANMLRKGNILTDENVEGLAQVINWATGRGSFPKNIQNTLIFI